MLDSSSELAEAVGGLVHLQQYQTRVDSIAWTTANGSEEKRRHISFHVTIAAGKLARVEERMDHESGSPQVIEDVAADLLVYALQLANLQGLDLGELYRRRTQDAMSGKISHGPV